MLILSILSYYFPKVVFAGQSRMYAKSTNTTAVTEHKPDFQASPEKDKPEEKEVIEVDKKYVVAGIGLMVIGPLLLPASPQSFYFKMMMTTLRGFLD